MALPILLGAMAVGSLVQTGVGLWQQHKMHERDMKAMEMMQNYQQQQNQMLMQFMGGQGQMPGGMPQFGQQQQQGGQFGPQL